MGTAAQSHPTRAVLVVDDEELICRLTARILEDAGFRVLEAHSGEEAIAVLASVPGEVQLVVSDIAMPGMSGQALAEAVAIRWPAVPVLLMSGQGGPKSGYRGAFLPKPFTADALLAAAANLSALPPQGG